MMEFSVLLVLGYFLGSIPFAWWMVRMQGKDLKKIGSGSLGTTNVIRAVGLFWGLIVLFLDIAKGAIPTVIALSFGFSAELSMMVGLMAILGHVFSPWMGFKGGKGAATGIGVIAVLMPKIFVITAVIVIFLVLITRYQSVGTLVGVWIPPLMLLFETGSSPWMISLAALGAVFIWWKHRPNIMRLLAGQENKIGKQ